MSSDDLENYEAERELQLAQEYQDVAPMFRYAVETERRFYLANDVHVTVSGEPSKPVIEVARSRGQFGEDEAARWYAAQGYRIAARNWRCPLGELDLVVAAPGAIVFVEVKARATDRFGGAVAAVGWDKQRRLRRLAARWLAEHPEHHGHVRFDVAAVTGTTLQIYEAAF